MSKFKSITAILLSLTIWTVFLAYGISDGFILRPLTSGDSTQDFTDAVEKKIADEFVGNLALVLIEDGDVAASYYHSVDKSISDSTVFLMASVSKWITAWGVFKLIQDGLLDLDEPVDNYLTRWNLPESEFDNDGVTVRTLLSHTSGLIDDLGYAGFDPGEPVQTIEESLTKAADAPWSEGRAIVGFEPGSQYMYSGAAYTLLQLVIEEVTGQSFQTYMTRAIFVPLQMRHSTFVWSDTSSWDRATSFDTDGSVVFYSTFTALAAASLYTTTADLALFVKANSVEPNPVLRESTLEAMYTAHAFTNDIGIHALGPAIFARDGEGLVIHGHDGYGDPAINNAARINRSTGDGIIIFETGHPELASSIADQWIFWKTGIADFVVIMANKSWLLTLLFGGYGLILGIGLVRFVRSRQT